MATGYPLTNISLIYIYLAICICVFVHVHIGFMLFSFLRADNREFSSTNSCKINKNHI